jgi:hypothetical protein
MKRKPVNDAPIYDSDGSPLLVKLIPCDYCDGYGYVNCNRVMGGDESTTWALRSQANVYRDVYGLIEEADCLPDGSTACLGCLAKRAYD